MSPNWQHWPGSVLYRVLSGLFGLLPEPAMRRTGEVLGRLLFYIAGDRRRMSIRHLRRVVGEGATPPVFTQREPIRIGE